MQFNGQIPEFSQVRIDNFTLLTDDVRYAFISHAHEDHLAGLANVNMGHLLIFCTEATKQLIRSTDNPAYNKNVSRIRTHKFNETFMLDGGLLRVTFIPAYHCVGSAMVLLESDTQRVLFTGDARFDSPSFEVLRTNHKLLEREFLDCLYLDTTFSYRDENICIPDRFRGIAHLVKMIEKYPPGTTFSLRETTCGFEEVWLRLGLAFGFGSLVFDRQVSRRLRHLAKVSDPLQLMLNPADSIMPLLGETIQDTKYKFYIGKGFENKCQVNVRSAINVTPHEFDLLYGTRRRGEFKHLEKAEGMFTGILPVLGVNIERQYVENPAAGLLLPCQLRFIFSRHSSYDECVKFVHLFKSHLQEVYPIVGDQHSWSNGFTIQRYFGKACLRHAFRYDTEMAAKYGKKPLQKSDQAVVVDYWKSFCGNAVQFKGRSTGYSADMAKLDKYRKLLITNKREVRIKQLLNRVCVASDNSSKTDSTDTSSDWSVESFDGRRRVSFHVTCSFSEKEDTPSEMKPKSPAAKKKRRLLVAGNDSRKIRKRISKIL